MAIKQLFSGVAVEDYASALAWYERLWGRPPDVIVKDDEAMWQVTDGGWVYVVADGARAGRGLLTLLVDDLDARLAEFAARGLTVGPVDTIAESMRRAVMTDPDGNTIAFGQGGG